MLKGSSKNQYYATFLANLTTLVYGVAIGWSSPTLTLLQSEDSPLKSGPISIDEASWLSSLPCLGGLFGTIFFGWMAEFLGRKSSIMAIGIPQILCWSLKEFGTNVNHLYVARIMAGVAGSGTFILVPLFVSEISEDRIRGLLGSILSMSCNLGILVGFIMHSCLGYYVTPLIIITMTLLTLFGFVFVAESPKYLLMKNKFEEAEAALMYYRGVKVSPAAIAPSVFTVEFNSLKVEAAGKSQNNNNDDEPSDKEAGELSIKDFCRPAALKAIVIGVLVMALPPLSGLYAIMSYSESIFQEAGSSLSPMMSSIIVIFIQLVGSYISTILVDKSGRKVLLLVSTVGSSLSLAVMGTYAYLKHLGVDIRDFTWLPIASLSALVFLVAIGIASIPFIVVTEVLSQKIRGTVSTWCAFELWLLAFAVIKLFPLVQESIGLYGVSWIFAATLAVSALCVAIMVPETKGKSIERITEILGGKRN